MKIIENSETFTQTVNSSKSEKKHCATNMLIMQDKVNDLIEGRKLYYDLIDGVLWLFVKHEDYYVAYFYLPKGEKLKMVPQDLDVIVELIGNQTRYNSEWETGLLETGFEKYNKYFEFVTKKEEYQDFIEKQAEKMYSFVERMGCCCRSAKKEDYNAMYQLRRAKIDKYEVYTLTDKEIEEMETHNRSILVLNKENEIIATCCYSRMGNTALGMYGVSLQKGFGAVVSPLVMAFAFREGCDRLIAWIWENNTDSLDLKRWFGVKTGKFRQKFLLRKAN